MINSKYAGNSILIWQITNQIRKATDYSLFGELLIYSSGTKESNNDLFLYLSIPF